MVLLLPAMGGAALVAGIRNDVFSAASGIWLLTVAAVLSALAALLWVAGVVDREEENTRSTLALQTETAANLTEGLCLRRESDGKILSVNPALKEIFGYCAGELTGTSRRLLTEENEAPDAPGAGRPRLVDRRGRDRARGRLAVLVLGQGVELRGSRARHDARRCSTTT